MDIDHIPNVDDVQKDDTQAETAGNPENSENTTNDSENTSDIKKKKQKKLWKLDKKSVITAAGILIALILIVIAAKGLLFKQPKKISIFGKQLVKSPKFPPLSKTRPQAVPQTILPKKVKVAKKVKLKTQILPVKAAQAPVISKNMRRMLKFNNTINKLKEEAKIASLNQQIKSLSRTGIAGVGGIAPAISLIGISKNLALLRFGKKDISMKTGGYYDGYRCLLINKSSVVLEKNNRTIHLNLSL